VRVVPLAEATGTPFILPSALTVSDGSYPLTRPLYLHIDKSPSEPLSPAVYELLRFITSRDGQEAVLRAGFFPLPMDEVDKIQVALKDVAHAPTP
jgi:phosphate transport system substrate-binding protein